VIRLDCLKDAPDPLDNQLVTLGFDGFVPRKQADTALLALRIDVDLLPPDSGRAKESRTLSRRRYQRFVTWVAAVSRIKLIFKLRDSVVSNRRPCINLLLSAHVQRARKVNITALESIFQHQTADKQSG